LSSYPGPAGLRWLATTIIVFCAPILLLVGLVGLFGDRATVIERLLIGVLNPIAGVAVTWAMLDEEFFRNWRDWVARLAAVALIGNLIAAVSIGMGWSEGDVELPIIFAMPFVAHLLWRSASGRWSG